ncbi:hypothetical protein [Peribacillus simplex]|uniref:hypothetical protein n=1 Tax=Peribacillus simplex TaxID=1478 RepID=UPI003CF7D76C
MNIFKSKAFWFSLGAVLIAPVLLNITIFQFGTSVTYGDGDEWLSFWGNYAGGILSGLVAFGVARVTLNEDRKKHRYDLYMSQLPSLIRIRMEMEKIRTNIEKAYEQKAKLIKSGESRSDYNVEEYPLFVELVDKEKWSYLDKIQDIDLQVKLIEIKEFYNTFSNSLVYDGIFEKERFSELIVSIGLHKQEYNPDNTTVEQMEKYRKIEDELQYHYFTRTQSWKRLDEGFKETIENTYLDLLNAIEELKEEKAKFENEQ